jgi:hypothetical protein
MLYNQSMQKLGSATVTTVVLGAVGLVIIAGVLGYLLGRGSLLPPQNVPVRDTFYNTGNAPTTIPSVVDQNRQNKISIPAEYVKPIPPHDARHATFLFAVPINAEDITGNNVKTCIVSGSASNAGDTTCASLNGIDLKYNSATRTLSLTDVTVGNSQWQEGFGPFRTGCAACSEVVEFTGIHTTDGQELPKKLVGAY